MLGMRERGGLGVVFPGSGADVGVGEDVQTFGVRGHERVFDAVVDHLHEVACAAWPAVEVALFLRWRRAVAALGSGRGVDARGEGGEDRLEMSDRVCGPADRKRV